MGAQPLDPVVDGRDVRHEAGVIGVGDVVPGCGIALARQIEPVERGQPIRQPVHVDPARRRRVDTDDADAGSGHGHDERASVGGGVERDRGDPEPVAGMHRCRGHLRHANAESIPGVAHSTTPASRPVPSSPCAATNCSSRPTMRVTTSGGASRASRSRRTSLSCDRADADGRGPVIQTAHGAVMVTLHGSAARASAPISDGVARGSMASPPPQTDPRTDRSEGTKVLRMRSL